MCFGSSPAPQPAKTPAPPPPPPADTPQTPVLNEAGANSLSGANVANANRKGTNSLKIDLATPGMTQQGGSGLAIG